MSHKDELIRPETQIPGVWRLQAGDVIFHRPKEYESTDELNFGFFPVLAAYVQSYPYRWNRLWHHVSVCVGTDPIQVVDFGVADGTQFFGERLEVADRIVPPPIEVNGATLSIEYDVLRSQDEEARPLIAQIVENQVGSGGADGAGRPSTPYSAVGLIAFAFAMAARLLPGKPDARYPWPDRAQVRDRLLDRAVGADLVAQAMSGETCTSSVAKAVHSVVGLTIQAPPDAADNERGVPDESVVKGVAQLARRGGVDVDAVLAEAPLGELVGWAVRQGAVPGDGGEVVVDPPPAWLPPSASTFILTREFLDALGMAAEVALEGITMEDLEALGQRHRPPDGELLTYASTLTSPAMLYDALRVAGFENPFRATQTPFPAGDSSDSPA